MTSNRTEFDKVFDEVEELRRAREDELRGAKAEEEDPADRPASKIVHFRWYDRVLGRKVEEPFEIRLMTYKERIHRARTAGLMAQVSWAILPEDAQQYLMALATSNILWPKASESWKRTILEREEVAIMAYVTVEAHRQEYFRGDDGQGGESAEAMGLEVLPVRHPAANAKP